MKIKTALTTLTVLALVAVFWLPAAFSQDDIVELKVDAFGMGQRPAAVFKHDEHNEKAELEDDCARCHHVYENGSLVADEDSAGTACAECHALEAQGRQPGLRMAYHNQCKGCHATKAAGPVACGECHQK